MSGQERWQEVCPEDDVPVMGGRLVRIGTTQIALFRLSDGTVRAVDNRCPHKQGPLAEGIVSGDSVICPLHARRIDLKSGEVLPPDHGCVTVYPTRVEQGRVWIRL